MLENPLNFTSVKGDFTVLLPLGLEQFSSQRLRNFIKWRNVEGPQHLADTCVKLFEATHPQVGGVEVKVLFDEVVVVGFNPLQRACLDGVESPVKR